MSVYKVFIGTPSTWCYKPKPKTVCDIDFLLNTFFENFNNQKGKNFNPFKKNNSINN